MRGLLLKIMLFSTFVLPSSVQGEGDPYDLGEIVVTASRIPVAFSQLSRNVTVINSEDIEDAPVNSLPELLAYVAGIDVRRRGIEGIQADISIRGSTFEQVLILIDGIKVSDPQTGHHNMDIPLTLADIERIEILHGQGSSIHGPNAFGGVINIITKSAKGRKGEASLILGENSLSAGTLSLSFPWRDSAHTFSLERKKSSGYQYNTEFDISTLYYHSAIETSFAPFDFSIGYTDKEFGADSFYSNLYPNEWEETETTLANLRARFGVDQVVFEPKLYWRRHWDKFVLDRTVLNGFVNRHTTHVYGTELDLHIQSSWYKLVLGGEIGEETIESTNLGDHSRTKQALFAEFQPDVGNKFLFDIGMRGDHYEGWGWEGSPSIGLGYRISPTLKVRTSVGHSLRVPTYTELYYDSPANKGNPDLRSEESWSYETGFDWIGKGVSLGTTLFRREGQNLIDWVRQSSSDPWEARNIGEIDTDGLEILFKIKPCEFDESSAFSLVSIGYAYLNSDKVEDNLQSKYVMDYLRHQVSVGLNRSLPFNIRQTLKLSYEDRVNGDNYFLLDTRFSKEFERSGIEIFVKGTNLLDTSYQEVGGVPMPGRWILGGMKIEF